ncbi:hypothetical protein RJT34_11133 [Clitoria ternatea]|uniref:Uncharacterized protein n=1 Tax=Clitoria ternatea TaxID=43366 RepID=A0AAN9PJ81_CLITE
MSPLQIPLGSGTVLPHAESGDDDELLEKSILRKGPWTAEEDEILADYVRNNGTGNWNAVSKRTGLARCGKSCRLRWSNHLKPDLKKGAFNAEEQRKVIQLHALMGNKWAKMAQELPGRTDNEIKNFWNTRTKKRKRAGLPLYPDDIKPLLNIDKKENSADDSTHQANVSQNDSPTILDSLFIDYKLGKEEHSSYIPSILDITDINTSEQQDSDYKQLHQDSDMLHKSFNLPGIHSAYPKVDWAFSRGLFLASELPPFPSFDDIQRDDSQAEHYESIILSPSTSGLLKSVFYQPNILEDSCNYPFETQRGQNPAMKENSNQKELTRLDSCWLENYDKDQYALKDTLFAVIEPYVNRNTSS